MTIILSVVLIYFFALPIIGGAFSLVSGMLKPRFRRTEEEVQRNSPFNPFYQQSPFNLG